MVGTRNHRESIDEICICMHVHVHGNADVSMRLVYIECIYISDVVVSRPKALSYCREGRGCYQLNHCVTVTLTGSHELEWYVHIHVHIHECSCMVPVLKAGHLSVLFILCLFVL